MAEEIDIQKEKKIRAANDYKSLYSALEEIGSIESTHGRYTSGELRDIIEGTRRDKHPIEAVPRVYGLREKVEWLNIKTSLETEYSPPIRHSTDPKKDLPFWQYKRVTPKADEGFKVHISTDSMSYDKVKSAVLPILQKHKVGHKVAVGEFAGTSGKVVTIWSDAETPIRKICDEIDDELVKRGATGPTIKNEEPLPGGRSGLVYIRYGAFRGGKITGPSGEKIEDIKRPDPIPNWKQGEFESRFGKGRTRR